MSGMGGWSGRRDQGYDDYPSTPRRDSSYDRARSSLDSPGRSWSGVTSGPQPSQRVDWAQSVVAPPQPQQIVNFHTDAKLTSKARNVLIIALDRTGSFGDWPDEIIDRGQGLLDEMAKYTGTDDNEILIIGFGDGPRGDSDPIMVAPAFGSDARLADYLKGLRKQGGGANGVESSNLALQYVMRYVDTSSAANVWLVIVTDEGTYSSLKAGELSRYFESSSREFPEETDKAVELLRTRMNVFCVFCDGEGIGMDYDRRAIMRGWEGLLGPEFVVPIEFKQRLVDKVLLVVANTVGQGDTFMADFIDRQKKAGTQFTDANIKSMQRASIKIQSGSGSKVIAPQKSRKSIINI